MPISTPVGSQLPPEVPVMERSDPNLVSYLRRLSVWMTGQLSTKVPRATASSFVLLQSPGGSVYKVVVSDAGVISTEFVAPGSSFTAR